MKRSTRQGEEPSSEKRQRPIRTRAAQGHEKPGVNRRRSYGGDDSEQKENTRLKRVGKKKEEDQNSQGCGKEGMGVKGEEDETEQSNAESFVSNGSPPRDDADAWGAATALIELFSRNEKTSVAEEAQKGKREAPPLRSEAYNTHVIRQEVLHPSAPDTKEVKQDRTRLSPSSHPHLVSPPYIANLVFAREEDRNFQLSPRSLAKTEAENKHNKYCHFCQHIKVKKARSMRACSNAECARRFCEHCLLFHLKEEPESMTQTWRCPICRRVCCCASQSCSKVHRHCKAYRYRQRRAELAAKKTSVGGFEDGGGYGEEEGGGGKGFAVKDLLEKNVMHEMCEEEKNCKMPRGSVEEQIHNSN